MNWSQDLIFWTWQVVLQLIALSRPIWSVQIGLVLVSVVFAAVVGFFWMAVGRKKGMSDE